MTPKTKSIGEVLADSEQALQKSRELLGRMRGQPTYEEIRVNGSKQQLSENANGTFGEGPSGGDGTREPSPGTAYEAHAGHVWDVILGRNKAEDAEEDVTP